MSSNHNSQHLRGSAWRARVKQVRADLTEAGQSMVEYAIVAALIAIVAMATVQAFGGGISNVFSRLLSRIEGIG